MSEKMAGIFALNVINEKDYMEINGVKILKKEFNGEKVLTAWDIAKIHRRETLFRTLLQVCLKTI